MDWQRHFADRVRSAKEAIARIRPGRRILIGSGAAEPAQLVRGLVDHGEHLADNEIVHLLTLGPAPYVAPDMQRRFRHTAFFIGANVRDAVHAGRADYMPVFLGDLPRLLRSGRVAIDVALIQVTPPDRRGYVSLGVSVDIVRAAVDCAELVLAEVNPHMPRTHGASFLEVDRIDSLVPVEDPLFEVHVDEVDDVDRAIGIHVAELVPDGATLQVGIGRVPNAVLAALVDKRDLGIHTEMFSDGVMDLVERGVVTGRRKTLLPGKIVTSFLLGSRELYAWADENPAIEMRPTEFTNDPITIARNDDMVAINTALAIDLTGQVAADSIPGAFYSGIGGQVDFIRGAARSVRGRPIIALPSTTRDGRTSTIRPALEEGAGIVTSRGDVHYVVTEYGIADLWGKNVRQRALALIEIAHPDFRQDLLEAAKEKRYVLADQATPRVPYPFVHRGRTVLRGGRQVLVRPVQLTDEPRLQAMFYRLSDESTYRRFLCHKRTHSHEEMQRLVDVDYEASVALLVVSAEEPEEILGMARYDVDPATGLADIAFVVRDECQGQGIGSLLMRRMTEIAKRSGLQGFEADVLLGNQAMLRVFQHSGLAVRSSHEEGSLHLEMHLRGE